VARKIYQIKVTLQGASPPVWRRIVVSCNLTMRQAQGVIQKAMGWRACSDYRFRLDGREFGQDPETSEYFEDDTMFSLRYCLCVPGDAMEYLHDGLNHAILLEAITEARGRLPWCVVAGEGACPTTLIDVAGLWPREQPPSKAFH
jgi:hypothetical protein